MEADIRAGRYLEHGEYEGNLYGTRIDSIRGVVAAGKVCVLDVNPQVLPLCSFPACLMSSLLPQCSPIVPGTCHLSTPVYPLCPQLLLKPSLPGTFLSVPEPPLLL